MPKYEITTESGKKYLIETESKAPAASQPVSQKGKVTMPGAANISQQRTAAVGDFLGMGALGRGFGASVLGALSPEVRAARQAQAGETQAVANLPAETLRRMASQGKTIQESGAIRDIQQGTTQDLTNKQVIGSAVSTALLAGGGAFKAPLQGSASALTRLGGRAALGSGLGAAQAGAVTTAQGKSNKEIRNATIAGGIIGGLLPVAFEGGKLAIKGTSKVSGLLTGQGSKQTQLLAERGASGRAGTLKPFKGQSSKQIAESSKKAVDAVRTARNTLYQRDMAAIDAAGGALDITPAKEAIKKKLLSDIRATITKDGVDFGSSKIGSDTGQSVVNKVYTTMDGWTDFSPSGVDALKQQISDIAFDAPKGSKAQQFAIEAQNKLKEVLDTVPGYKEVTSKYADTTKALQFAEEVLNLRTKKSTGDINYSTAMNKLGNVLKDNKAREIQYEALNELSKRSGIDLVGMVLSKNAKEFLPEGFVGKGAIALTGLATGLPGGVAAAPALLKAFLASSPAVASQVALRGGQLAGVANRTGITQKAQSVIPQLLGSFSANQ